MVTSDDSTKLSEIFASSRKWNLIDVAKRDAWLLATKAVLREDPEAFFAVTNGPIDLDAVQRRDPSLSLKQAKNVLRSLQATYDDAVARGYRLLLPRIDLSKRPSLASKILSTIEPEERGDLLWKIVAQACDLSSLGKQEELEAQYKAFKLTGKAEPTPEELSEGLTTLETLFLQIDGNSIDKPNKLMQRALLLLEWGSPASGDQGGTLSMSKPPPTH